uniref:Uncharacterized protein n=1 Tax=Timema bartmani TaxID=61472 RepID=A0A7R9ET97_9NEOP|nr:unnamed protein product [Timema bartmani]
MYPCLHEGKVNPFRKNYPTYALSRFELRTLCHRQIRLGDPDTLATWPLRQGGKPFVWRKDECVETASQVLVRRSDRSSSPIQLRRPLPDKRAIPPQHSTASHATKLLDKTVGYCSEDIQLLHESGMILDQMTIQSAIKPCVLVDARQKLQTPGQLGSVKWQGWVTPLVESCTTMR